MKKLLLFVLAVFAFAACTQDVEVQVTERHDAPDTITAGFEGDDTRIQLNEAQKTVWTKGDLVSVFYRSNANQQWKYNGETGARTATLKRVDAGTATRDMDRVVVVYPYNEDYYINPSTYNVQASLPATQTYLKNSYGLDGNIMISSAEYNDVTLKNVCGWLKLQLTGDGEVVKSISFKGNNGEQVAGELYINSADATAILASDMGDIAEGDGESATGGAGANLSFDDVVLKSVTLDCGEGVTLGAEATAFYIALPPQSFKDGFTVDVNCKGYKPMSISTQKDVIIERNHIQPMAEVAFSSEVRTIANNEIWYTATEKIEKSFWTFDTFGANIVSNEWDSVTGEGIIVFDGDVACIGDHAFNSILALNGITLPNTINRIGHSAFWGVRISDITIPKSVTEIGYMAFSTSALEYVIFESGSNLLTIDSAAFQYCSHLKSIDLPSSIESLGVCVFSGCKNLSSIRGGGKYYNMSVLLVEKDEKEQFVYKVVSCPSGYVSDKLQMGGMKSKIIWGAFAYGNIKHIDIWIKEIEKYNFIYDDVLERIDLYYTTQIGENVLSECSKLQELYLPSIESIGEYSFCENGSLKSIEISSERLSDINTIANNNECLERIKLASGVTSIVNSFNGCGCLTDIYCQSVVPPTLQNSFDSIPENATIYVPVESIRAYKRADGWSAFANNIVGYDFETGEIVESEPMPANNEIWYTSSYGNVVTPYKTNVFGATIVSNTYSDGKGIITFDGDVTMIGDDAFAERTSLTSVTIPDSVTLIGNGAFSSCTSLTSVLIPDSVTTIGNYAFCYCTSLTSVTIGDSVTTIGNEAFLYCKSLTEFNGKFAEDNGRILVIDGSLVVFAPAGLTESGRSPQR